MSDQQGRRQGATGSLHKARLRALDVLFEADLRERDILETFAEHRDASEAPVRELTERIVTGVAASQAELDGLISDGLAAGWTLGRMPRVDRVIARMATWEMLHGTSPQVAISQALLLATELSTDESPEFLNGLLAGISTALREQQS